MTAAQHDTEPPDGYTTLELSIDGRVGRITLDRPDKLNPLGSDALRELVTAARHMDDAGVDVVVISGSGRAFSAGFDLREFSERADSSAEPTTVAERTGTLGAAMTEAVRSMAAVTIAEIGGPAIGGGFVLAMACDLRVASADAWMSLPEAALGIPLAWSGVPLLVRQLGSARAMDLILSGRRMVAAEAAGCGLINIVVEPTELSGEVERRVGALLGLRSTVLRHTKQQVRDAAEALVPSTGSWAGTDALIAASSDD